MTIMLSVIGWMAVGWFLSGLIITCFFAKCYVADSAPMYVRLKSLMLCAFQIPWALLIYRTLPLVCVVPEPMPEDEKVKYEKWLNGIVCNCPNCRRRRGE